MLARLSDLIAGCSTKYDHAVMYSDELIVLEGSPWLEYSSYHAGSKALPYQTLASEHP
jgi:hypothetical protein